MLGHNAEGTSENAIPIMSMMRVDIHVAFRVGRVSMICPNVRMPHPIAIRIPPLPLLSKMVPKSGVSIMVP